MASADNAASNRDSTARSASAPAGENPIIGAARADDAVSAATEETRDSLNDMVIAFEWQPPRASATPSTTR